MPVRTTKVDTLSGARAHATPRASARAHARVPASSRRGGTFYGSGSAVARIELTSNDPGAAHWDQIEMAP
ncbi:MAG TPA: hypothetical protein VF989_12285 [Polyangiaceae bacterium]